MKTELIVKLIEILAGEKPTDSTAANSLNPEERQYIVVLDRGFVYVGNVKIDAEWVYISDAKNIRKWGTTKGLGELRNGPLSDTILDNFGIVLTPRKSLISLIPCQGF